MSRSINCVLQCCCKTLLTSDFLRVFVIIETTITRQQNNDIWRNGGNTNLPSALKDLAGSGVRGIIIRPAAHSNYSRSVDKHSQLSLAKIFGNYRRLDMTTKSVLFTCRDHLAYSWRAGNYNSWLACDVVIF